MIKYLVVLLDDTSVSYCQYNTPSGTRNLIPLDTLQKGLIWSFKENLSLQIVYPDYTIPEEYQLLLDSVTHTRISSSPDADVFVIETLPVAVSKNQNIVLRMSLEDLIRNESDIASLCVNADKVNIVITDICSFTDKDFDKYASFLKNLSKLTAKSYAAGEAPKINILTDRIFLTKMNNCNAGWENITLAPDGKFYVCPAFYFAGFNDIGNIRTGLEIRNPELYQLNHSPICRHCDAFQCRRCVWLNMKSTNEVNIPGRGQCIAAHLERNQSASLLAELKNKGLCPDIIDISHVDYLDPLDNRNNW